MPFAVCVLSFCLAQLLYLLRKYNGCDEEKKKKLLIADCRWHCERI